MTAPCEHDWKPRPKQSARSITRYQCGHCQRWGYRKWPRGAGAVVQPIQAYRSTSTAPNPEWDPEPKSGFEHERGERWLRRRKDELADEPWSPPHEWRDSL